MCAIFPRQRLPPSLAMASATRAHLPAMSTRKALSSEYGTYRTVKAKFWPELSSKSPFKTNYPCWLGSGLPPSLSMENTIRARPAITSATRPPLLAEPILIPISVDCLYLRGQHLTNSPGHLWRDKWTTLRTLKTILACLPTRPILKPQPSYFAEM